MNILIKFYKRKNGTLISFLSIFLITFSAHSQGDIADIIVGANRVEEYLPLIKGKKVGIVANPTSVIFKKNGTYTHLVDTLLNKKINIKKIFAPEHSFRGNTDAGEYFKNDFDKKTGLPIVSLHGNIKELQIKDLKNIDVVIFDIQDVGVRFYTYISTLQYVMEACAKANKLLILLDRPNPNGHYIDGPVLEKKHKSFLGMNTIPIVYGMTIGEYAKMLNGEKWLKNKVQCNLKVIPLKNYTHQSRYNLPIRPSPNLPNNKAVNLYPSLGFFEGTTINAGRGTEMQFQIYGAPHLNKMSFSYTPKPNFGAKNPKHKGLVCYGENLRNNTRLNKINLKWLIEAYKNTPKSVTFFGDTFTVHVGNEELKKQIIEGISEEEIKKSWQEKLNRFKSIRKKYLLYK